MTIAVDVGTSAFRSLRLDEGRLMARRMAACYVHLPDDSDRRRLLAQAHVPFQTTDDGLIVVGDEAEALARVFGEPLIPVLSEAGLPEDDPVNRQIAAGIIESVVPPARGEAPRCVVTLPGDRDQPGDPLPEFFTRLLRLLNYRPQVIPSAYAAGLALLESSGLSGMVFCFGAGSCSAALLLQGRLVTSVCIPGGGQAINEQFARRHERFLYSPSGTRYLDLVGVEQWKCGWDGTLVEPRTAEEHTLTMACQRAVHAVWQEFSQRLDESVRRQIGARPLPLVCHGGATRLNGFDALLADELEAVALPLSPSEIRISEPDPWVVARGCLIYGEVASAGSSRAA